MKELLPVFVWVVTGLGVLQWWFCKSGGGDGSRMACRITLIMGILGLAALLWIDTRTDDSSLQQSHQVALLADISQSMERAALKGGESRFTEVKQICQEVNHEPTFMFADETRPDFDWKIRPGGSTNVKQAIDFAVSSLKLGDGDDLVVLTDGQLSPSQSQKLQNATAELQRRGVRLSALLTNCYEETTLRCHHVHLPKKIRQGMPFVISSLWSADHTNDDCQLELSIIRTDKSQQPTVVSSWTQHWEDQTSVLEVSRREDANDWSSGSYMLQGVLKDKNGVWLAEESMEVEVEIVNEPLRVLLVGEVPCFEYRYLKNMLEQTRSLTVQTWLKSSPVDYYLTDATAIQKLGDEGACDVIIVVGDNIAETVGNKWWEDKREQVVAGNLGMIIISTENQSDIEKTGGEFRGTLLGKELLTALQGLPDGSQVYFSTRENQIDVGVLVLAEITSGESNVPVVYQDQLGGGRMVVQLFDELWRLKNVDNGAWYRRYWTEIIQLVMPRLEPLPPGIEMDLDQSLQHAQQEMINVSLPGELVNENVILLAGEDEVVLHRWPENDAFLWGSITPFETGELSLKLLVNGISLSEKRVTVEHRAFETSPLFSGDQRLDFWKEVCQSTQGNVLSRSELQTMLSSPTKSDESFMRQAPWSRIIHFLAIVFLFCLDWSLNDKRRVENPL